MDLAKAGKIDDIDPKLFVGHYKTFKMIKADYKVMPRNLTWEMPPNIWIYGPTGTGKSHYARNVIFNGQPFYAKNAINKWWDKYNGEENVLIEDIDKTHDYQGFHLKIWADKYAFPVEVKNGGDLIRPKVIVVTSNYKIEEIFRDKSIYEPLQRRFRVVPKLVAWDSTVNDVLVREPINNNSTALEKASEILKRHRVTSTTDPELPRPKLFRQDATGTLVPWTNTQSIMMAERIDLTAASEGIPKYDSTESTTTASSTTNDSTESPGRNDNNSIGEQMEIVNEKIDLTKDKYYDEKDAFELSFELGDYGSYREWCLTHSHPTTQYEDWFVLYEKYKFQQIVG